MGLFVALLAVGAAWLYPAARSLAAELPMVSFGGGPAGGAWAVQVGVAVTLLNEKAGQVARFSQGATGGSVESIRRMGAREMDTSWAHIPNMYDAWNGVGLWAGKPKIRNIRAIAKIVDQTQIFVVLKDSPYHTFKDLAGKRLMVGPAGSGSEVNSRFILQALGIFDNSKIFRLEFGAGGRALRDGQVDMYSSAGAPWTMPAITEIAFTKPVRYIPITDEEYEKIRAKHPYYERVTIPAGVIQGVDAPVPGVRYGVWWLALDATPDRIVTAMLKATFENRDELAKVGKNWATMTGDFAGLAGAGVKIHPAAIQFWKDKKGKFPKELLQ